MITFVNCASVKWATRMQNVFTVAKMVAIVMLVITGLVRLSQGNNARSKSWGTGDLLSIALWMPAFFSPVCYL